MDALVIKRLTELIENREQVALVTVINKLGSGPRDRGSMMLVGKDGELIIGTIGGGGVEERAKKDAKECIRLNKSEAFHYELTLKQTEHSLGMACGGTVDIFIKVFKTELPLIIFGAGHIGLSLCKFAKDLGYHVIIVDQREEYANKERFPNADQIITGSMENIVKSLEVDENTSIVIVTHGHIFDIEALKSVLDSNARYIGMIGSVNKINHCYKELLKEGANQTLIDRVHAPIGLDIGGDSPAEIALAILAEIQAVRYNKKGPFLKELRRDRIE